jgi:Tfp pilus assembly PilM family ATPase
MAKRKKTVCGLAISPSAITLAQSYPEERLITNVSIQGIENPSEDTWESAADALKILLEETKLAGENVICSLPSEYSIIKRIAIDQDEADVEQALEWELSQQLIGSMEDYAFDYQRRVHQEQTDQQEYLVVAYHAEAVNRMTELLESNRLKPLILDIDIFALINLFEVNYPERSVLPAVVVFGDERMTKLALTRGGDFFDMEAMQHTEEHDNPQVYLQAIRQRLSELLAFNEGFVTGNDSLQTIITGPLFTQQQYRTALVEGMENSIVLNPFAKISCSAGMGEEDIDRYGPQLAVAVGLALRGMDEIL